MPKILLQIFCRYTTLLFHNNHAHHWQMITIKHERKCLEIFNYGF